MVEFKNAYLGISPAGVSGTRGYNPGADKEGEERTIGGKRTDISGWSQSSARRHTSWVHSVDATELKNLHGYAITLTLPNCPPTPLAFDKMRCSWEARLKRYAEDRGLGHVLVHWVKEMTKKCVPHLHYAVYFEKSISVEQQNALVMHWVDVVQNQGYEARRVGQDIKEIWGLSGWHKYQSKHLTRTMNHVQREQLPEQWQNKSGRMWGYSGKWPIYEPIVIRTTADIYNRHRLELRKFVVEKAQQEVEELESRTLRYPNDENAKRFLESAKAWLVRAIEAYEENKRNPSPEEDHTGYRMWASPEEFLEIFSRLGLSSEELQQSVSIEFPRTFFETPVQYRKRIVLALFRVFADWAPWYVLRSMVVLQPPVAKCFEALSWMEEEQMEHLQLFQQSESCSNLMLDVRKENNYLRQVLLEHHEFWQDSAPSKALKKEEANHGNQSKLEP